MMATLERLEILLWLGDHAEIRRDGELIYAGDDIAGILAALSTFFEIVITTAYEKRKWWKAVAKPTGIGLCEVKERATASPEKLEILLWRGEQIEIRRAGEVVYHGRSFASVLTALSNFFRTALTCEPQTGKRAKKGTKSRVLGVVRGFFGRSYETRAPFTPPAPPLLPEQRLTSPAERARLKVARGIPLSCEEEDALVFGAPDVTDDETA